MIKSRTTVTNKTFFELITKMENDKKRSLC